ncbi:hypothetical protein [Embleya sp. NPDC059237]|uniref:hypothetical protein n=1 Tax=Embleya sp. NPDC059237 TaxID=3346784 RepID=UPI0036756FAC
MALINPPLLVAGGTHEARAFRMMLRDMARGAEGVTEGDDLRVRALSAPGPAVLVGDGSAVILGRAGRNQGAYTAYNLGDATVQIAPTGATPRTDLLVLRITDPEYEGVLNPVTDAIANWYVISNLNTRWPGIRRPPGVGARLIGNLPQPGMTYIPLAEIHVPANTVNITSSMITDLRNVANPRQSRQVEVASPGGDVDAPWLNPGTWYDWPPCTAWRVWVPEWAVYCRAQVSIHGLQINGGWFWGAFGFALGSVAGQSTNLDTSALVAGNRSEAAAADSLYIPPEMRGTWQQFTGRITRWSDGGGGIPQTDTATTAVLDLDFIEDIW